MKNKILLKRHVLVDMGNADENYEYLAAKLLNTFGVVVDKPQRLNHIHVKQISEFFGINIPSSFYNNPQDLKYFTCDELLVERLVSYFKIEFITGVDSDNQEDFDRVEIFKKALPNYEEGKEVKFREYKIVTREDANELLKEYADNLSSYTRPWSLTEKDEFIWLYENGYYAGSKIRSKDNTIEMFNKYEVAVFAKSLDQKDVVKLSIQMKGEKKQLSFTEQEITKLKIAVENCYEVPLSKKQAKYFNTLNKHLKTGKKKFTNELSPYKQATKLVNQGDIVGAARVFAKNGSLLERNLAWLLSRADEIQVAEIMELVKVNNPLVSIQLVNGLLKNSRENRTFTYYVNNKIRKYTETDSERMWRKSVLTEGIKKLVKEIMDKKIDNYYRELPTIGKVYINEIFKKVSIPLNTSATGSGLDVLPVGSRLPITFDNIRTFTYWNDVRDIDTSVTFIKDGKVSGTPLFWGTYDKKQFGNSALTSGDDRSSNGSEYIDFRISELKQLGYTHAVYSLNGYGGNLNQGEIFTGFQNKDNLDTQAWSFKNIEAKIQVKGDSRAYIAFAIDFETREVIIVNQMLESGSRVVTTDDYKSIKQYLDKTYLENFNVYKIASLRGEVVETPEEAEIVFDNDYVITDEQKQIKTFEVDKIVKLLN